MKSGRGGSIAGAHESNFRPRHVLRRPLFACRFGTQSFTVSDLGPALTGKRPMRSALEKLELVEAAGVEPASEVG